MTTKITDVKAGESQNSDSAPIDHAPWGAWLSYRTWRGQSLRRITDMLLDDEAEAVLGYARTMDRELARICLENGLPRGQVWNSQIIPALQRRVHPPPPRPSSLPGSDIFEQARRVDIVRIAERVTELQASGDTLKGRCPLHTERTPSFVITPARQSWRCFGACADGGDGIKLMRRLIQVGRWSQ